MLAFVIFHLNLVDIIITVTIVGLEAWASGKLEDFGKLISASGLSSIENYECGMA